MKENGKSASSTTLISTTSIEVSFIQRTLWLLNTFYYQVLAIISIIFLWVFFDAYAINAPRLWHLVLSTAAYVPLMAAAIILFSENNLPTIYIQRTRRYTIHGILLFISCAAVTAGIALETDAKRKAGRSHFVSNHAILGLVSWILIFISVLIGLAAANTRTFSTFIKPVVVKLVHNFLGLAAFAIGIASLYEMLAIIQRNTSATAFVGFKIGLIYITVWSGLTALKSLFDQIKGVFS